MFIGYSSMQRKGYDVKDLIEVIGKIIDADESLNVAVVGFGNLGKAVTTYFKGKRSKLNIIAALDIDPNKIGKVLSGVKCHSIEDIETLVKESNISIAILTVPADDASKVATRLVNSGIKGILNFTTIPLNVPSNIHLEEYDMITSLEKVAYFVKNQ